MALAGTTFCLSGRLSSAKAQVEERIRAAGGTCVGCCTRAVTHLLCSDPGSKKAQTAAKNGAAVVDEAWLEAALEAALADDAADAADGDVADAADGVGAAGAGPLAPGESVRVQGRSATYTVKNVRSGYSCTCPAWRNQSTPSNERRCKHINELLGEAPPPPVKRADRVRPGPPGVLLAAKLERGRHDIRGWWVSEKLDGVRAVWNGTHLVSRAGNAFDAPDWFTAQLPTDGTLLDGELFTARKQFNTTVSIVRSAADERWSQVQYLVFDAPSVEGPFEDRMAWLAGRYGGVGCVDEPALLTPECPGGKVGVVPHTRAVDQDQVDRLLREIDALGGEGLMLREPESPYRAGRQKSLLKLKSFHDLEGEVFEVVRGQGRHAHRMGALRCRLATGHEFSVGTGFTDKQRDDPPAVGSIVTVQCPELTENGVPRFPVYVGVRVDLSPTQFATGA